MVGIVETKRVNSESRIDILSKSLSGLEELSTMGELTIFVAGSYARNEASIHSDIDLFFVLDGELKNLTNPNLKSMRAFSRIIEEADKMKFPTFSNDGEFLRILEREKMKKELGGRKDDYLNYFTARMLLLLESKCIFGQHTYDNILRQVVDDYFRDYTHHPKDFKPVFLINDIIRFWKTLCLNYENKRNQPEDDSIRKTKQKVKNFKLKFSRMLTCFGSIAAIIDMDQDAGPEGIISLGTKSPFERLASVVEGNNELHKNFSLLVKEYEWFLETTNVTGEKLIDQFKDKDFKEDAFLRAEVFGESMYEIVHAIATKKKYLRYLLI